MVKIFLKSRLALINVQQASLLGSVLFFFSIIINETYHSIVKTPIDLHFWIQGLMFSIFFILMALISYFILGAIENALEWSGYIKIVYENKRLKNNLVWLSRISNFLIWIGIAIYLNKIAREHLVINKKEHIFMSVVAINIVIYFLTKIYLSKLTKIIVLNEKLLTSEKQMFNFWKKDK